MANELVTTTDEQDTLELAARHTRQLLTPQEAAAALIPQSYAEAWDIARAFAGSRMYKVNSPEQAMVILLTGMDMGVTPSVAFRGIHVIEGKPSPSSDLLMAACKARREICRYFQCVETSDVIATFETHREGDPNPTRLSYTLKEAEQAGLLGKDNWRKYRPAMLRARAVAALARLVYPDITTGLYIPDELSAKTVDIEGEYDEPATEPVNHATNRPTSRPAATRSEPPSVIDAEVVTPATSRSDATAKRRAECINQCEKGAKKAFAKPADFVEWLGREHSVESLGDASNEQLMKIRQQLVTIVNENKAAAEAAKAAQPAATDDDPFADAEIPADAEAEPDAFAAGNMAQGDPAMFAGMER